jgi:hypothetical protein
MAVGDIILGDGAFYINDQLVGLTRGGGQFTVEREYRMIEADGDFGPVKGRNRKIRSTPKLTMNVLEITAARMPKLYPALSNSSTGTGALITGSANIADADYVEVKWVGATKDGTEIIITVENAINMENIDFALVDKEEVIASVTFTGTYLEASRTVEPWSVEYVT